jgi:hypothetical protein
MKRNLVRKWFVAGALVAFQAFPAAAQNEPGETPSPPKPPTPQLASSASVTPVAGGAAQNETPQPAAKSLAQRSAGVEEILKMVQAGVSKDVLKAYIETAPIASSLSAADIVVLKERGLPDDLTVALLKRTAELAAQAKETAVSNAFPARATGTVSLKELVAALRRSQSSPASLDPEGYDYFQYYYLYPRTLASANARLFSSYPFPWYPAHSFGYWTPRPFRPRSVGP